MKVTVKDWHAVAHWRWATGNDKDKEVAASGGATQDEDEDEEDLCGICRVPFEGCCPNCKVPGDDCPLSKLTPSLSPFPSLFAILGVQRMGDALLLPQLFRRLEARLLGERSMRQHF